MAMWSKKSAVSRRRMRVLAAALVLVGAGPGAARRAGSVPRVASHPRRRCGQSQCFDQPPRRGDGADRDERGFTGCRAAGGDRDVSLPGRGGFPADRGGGPARFAGDVGAFALRSRGCGAAWMTEALELKPYYLKNGNRANPRGSCHVIAGFQRAAFQGAGLAGDLEQPAGDCVRGRWAGVQAVRPADRHEPALQCGALGYRGLSRGEERARGGRSVGAGNADECAESARAAPAAGRSRSG